MLKEEIIAKLERVIATLPPGNASEGQYRAAHAMIMQLIADAEGPSTAFLDEIKRISQEDWGPHYKADSLRPIVKSYIEYVSISSHSVRQQPSTKLFVNLERFTQLSQISNTNFDFRRLIKLLEELNACFSSGCFHAVGMLTRSILDHVPPLFGKKSFAEVVSNYSGTKSFKETMTYLDGAQRKIADSYLHSQIRSKESLPNDTQVDFSQALDMLLAEIVRLFKS